MSDVLGPLVLVVFCLLVSYWEYTRFRTVVTPFGALAWPYTIVVLMINFGGTYFGFFPVSVESILFVMICFGFFLVGGYGITFLLIGRRGDSILFKDVRKETKTFLDYYRPLFMVLALVCIVSGLFHFYELITEFGWANIGSKDFRDAYGSGILSHIELLGRSAFIFLFAYYLFYRKKSVLILLFLIGLTVIIRQVKYHIIVLLLSGIYFSYLHNLLKFNLKKIMIYALGIYVVFNLTYVIGFGAVGVDFAYSPKVQAFLLNHFFTYLFGGPIGFSEILKNPVYPMYSAEEIFAVPINMIRFLEGDFNYVNIIIGNWVPVSTIYKYFHSSNVFGIFGMLYAYIGSLATFIYTLVLGILAYTFMGLASRSRTGIGFQFVYVYVLGFLTISFFGLYFNMLSFVEVSFYMVIIPSLYILGREIMRFAVLQHKTS